jgi:hemoglobin-like flavoprotein
MDHDTTVLVRSSWRRVESIAPAAAALFYDNLFAADPQLKPLFKSDIAHQGERLMKMIGAAVDKLDDLPTLVPVLEGLARRHVDYGVRESHYTTVGAALLKTLGQGLGDDFTPAARDAWTRVYGLIAEVMVAAARERGTAPVR